MKTLVVYYSYSGNTKSIAKKVAEELNTDLLELEPVKAYSSDYDTVVQVGQEEVNRNTNASIYFYHKGLIKYVGVMLKGKMEVLTDQETKNMIWKTGDTMFYKKGVTDPDYCVLKFTATSGRYYCDLKTESFDIE